MGKAPIDDNHHKGLIAKNQPGATAEALTSTTVGIREALDTVIRDASGNQITSFGVQYTEGDTDASITGTAMLMETPGDTLSPLQGVLPMAGQNSLLTTGSYREITALSASGLSQDLVPSTDVSWASWISLHIQGTYNGTVTFQASNDGSDFRSTMFYRADNTGNIATSTTGTGIIYCGPRNAKYLRVRMTSYSSGTATATLDLFSQPPAYINNVQTVTQSGTWTVQPGNTANTTAWLVTDKGGTCTPSRVATSTSSATLVASNTARKQVVIFNDSAGILYAKFGAAATSTDFTYKIAAGQSVVEQKYTGRIDGILDTGTGNAQVSEVT